MTIDRSGLRPGTDRAPRRLATTVNRDRVVKRFLDADRGDLVTVAAPAGYGKSTAVALWDEAEGSLEAACAKDDACC